MPETWINALEKYWYPVNLTEYCGAQRFPNYFKQIILGNRESTIHFENYFRKNSLTIEPWFEVVFWKMYSQPHVSDQQTCRIVKRFTNPPMVPTALIETAKKFMASETFNEFRKTFDSYRSLFGYSTKAIATVATFPAFLDPINFPMVDTRVAKWVNSQYTFHNQFDAIGSQLIPSIYGRISNTNMLTMADFDFYYHWIMWTRHMAKKLSAYSDFQWRARDVEMAVFTAWGGGKGRKEPLLKLNPIKQNTGLGKT
jgi:hypothetical protein